MKKLILPAICFFLACACSELELLDEQTSSLHENRIESTLQTSTKNSSDSTVNINYYWYHGEKIYLAENDQKSFVVYKSTITPSRSNEPEDSMNRSNFLSLSNMSPVGEPIVHMSDYNWEIIDKNAELKIKTSSHEIVYESPFYISKKGNEIGISNLFYVKLKSENDERILVKFAERYNVKVLGKDKFLPLWYTLACDNESIGNTLQMTNIFHESGLFTVAEPDLMLNLQASASLGYSIPNDQYFDKQWNLNGQFSINWLNTQSITRGENVEIAIIDQGIDSFHPDFDFGSGLSGYDLVNPSYDGINIVYGNHGTACAGIIGATPNNGIGVSGIAPKAKLISFCHPLKAAPNIIQQLANGIETACLYYDVVSCSWGHEDLTSTMIEDALYYYAFTWGRNGKGTVVVFASGNDKRNTVSYPANCNDNILAVGAIGPNGTRCNFSNYGTSLDLVAPGENIPTTDIVGQNGYSPTDYILTFNGTSAACPHVAGVAALMLSVNPELTVKEVNDILEQTATKLIMYNYTSVPERSNGSWNVETGYGLVNAYKAVIEASNRKQ